MSNEAKETPTLVRRAVKNLLAHSPAFGQLPTDARGAMADDLIRVSTYLAAPEGIKANTVGGSVVVTPGDRMAKAVDFPDFVSRLINGVFYAIVDASIKQMEAYANLVKNVSQTVDNFAKDVVSDDHARRFLGSTFPDYFELENDRCIRLRTGIDKRQALKRLKHLDGRLTKLDQTVIEKQLVPAARKRIAANRQQILATMVLMGINTQRT